MEIEFKFLIKSLPGDLKKFQVKELEQGYLCVEPVVRIRKSNDDYILTYKSRTGIEQAIAGDVPIRMNQEVEVPLTREAYDHLKEKVDDHLVTKSRYIVPLPDGHTGELDVFHGRLEGLVFIEVEFKNQEDAESFVPPEWFGENVSGDHRYSNSFLSKCDDLSVFERR